MKMTRMLFGCLLALCIGFVSGCGGGSTETTTVDAGTAAEQAANDLAEEDYEAQMNEDDDADE